jgi:hypothetical protein
VAKKGEEYDSPEGSPKSDIPGVALVKTFRGEDLRMDFRRYFVPVWSAKRRLTSVAAAGVMRATWHWKGTKSLRKRLFVPGVSKALTNDETAVS